MSLSTRTSAGCLRREAHRHAGHSFGGQEYQVLVSVRRWSMLCPGQRLYLEWTEDLQVISGDGRCARAEQIKSRSRRRLTLASNEARQALFNFARIRRENVEYDVAFLFYTDATIARERATRWPAGQCGIQMWQQLAAADEKTALASHSLRQLRDYIAGLSHPEKVSATDWDHFINQLRVMPEQAFHAFVSRFHWVVERPDPSETGRTLAIELARSHGLSFSLAEDLRNDLAKKVRSWIHSHRTPALTARMYARRVQRFLRRRTHRDADAAFGIVTNARMKHQYDDLLALLSAADYDHQNCLDRIHRVRLRAQKAGDEDYFFASLALHGYAIARRGSWTRAEERWVRDALEHHFSERNPWVNALRWTAAKILRHVACLDERHRYHCLLSANRHVSEIHDEIRLPVPVLLPGTRSEIRDERVLETAFLDPPISTVPIPFRYKLAHGIAAAAEAKRLCARELGSLISDLRGIHHHASRLNLLAPARLNIFSAGAVIHTLDSTKTPGTEFIHSNDQHIARLESITPDMGVPQHKQLEWKAFALALRMVLAGPQREAELQAAFRELQGVIRRYVSTFSGRVDVFLVDHMYDTAFRLAERNLEAFLNGLKGLRRSIGT